MKDSITIVECPIVREQDGLAMSSRNMLLTADEREIGTEDIMRPCGKSV